ncbi:MAG: hypothetical protein MUO55_06885, partial [Candidatus Atribacteria bacterium]|nr:hypothetical protein [Candidatus Atribacteria bacterium]
YYSPRLSVNHYKIIPGVDGNIFLPSIKRYKEDIRTIAQVVEKAAKEAIKEFSNKEKKKITLAYLADGPYGVLLKN